MELKVQLATVFVLLLAYKWITSDNHDSENPIVITKLGQVKGSLMQTRQGKTFFAFRGLRYAESPTGPLRFKQAVPVKPWNNVFDASTEGPACPQEKGKNLSEDCLTLNIYTNQLHRHNTTVVKKIPVIVFLHSGAFYISSGQSFLYGPRYLLDQDVILVTVNYRLGTLGFINTGDHRAPGNLAFKDQVEALRFIRDNIASFGGDPHSVTLTGLSAGSRSIVLHMVSPMSRGLFHRAIAMSGSMTTPIPPQRGQIGLIVKQAELLNCTTETMDEMFRCLMEKPASEYGDTYLMLTEWRWFPVTVWYPSIEPKIPGVERFLSAEPEQLIRSKKINHVPLIIGVTTDEFNFEAKQEENEADGIDHSFFHELNNKWYELAPLVCQYERNTSRSRFISDELHKYYFDGKPITESNSDGFGRLIANSVVHFPVHRAASLIAKYSPAPVYYYVFSYQSPFSKSVWKDTMKPKGGVAHADDSQYLFNIENDIYYKPSIFPLYTDSDPQILMVKRLTTLWAHFAKTGEPLPKNLELFGNVTWERLSPETKRYLDMGEDFILKSDFLADTMKFWDNLFP